MKARAPKGGLGCGYPYDMNDNAETVVRNWVTADGKNAPDDIVHYFKEWSNATIAGTIVNSWRIPRTMYPVILGAVQLYRVGTLGMKPE